MALEGTATGLAATVPDPLDPNARAQLDLLDGEHLVRCWRVPLGFLVMTNLRCVQLWRQPHVLRSADWEVGPSFFFFDLAPPRIVAQRFVELREESPVSGRAFRFLVKDAEAVRDEIAAAIPDGQSEWRARRARAQSRGPPPTSSARPPVSVVVREVVKIRCRYCGNLMPEVSNTCPACGAPQA